MASLPQDVMQFSTTLLHDRQKDMLSSVFDLTRLYITRSLHSKKEQNFSSQNSELYSSKSPCESFCPGVLTYLNPLDLVAKLLTWVRSQHLCFLPLINSGKRLLVSRHVHLQAFGICLRRGTPKSGTFWSKSIPAYTTKDKSPRRKSATI